jgi:hypothetical protein
MQLELAIGRVSCRVSQRRLGIGLGRASAVLLIHLLPGSCKPTFVMHNQSENRIDQAQGSCTVPLGVCAVPLYSPSPLATIT